MLSDVRQFGLVVRRFGRLSCLHRELWHKFRPFVMLQFATEPPDRSLVHISTAAHCAPSTCLQYSDTPVGTKPQTLQAYCTYFARLSSIPQMTSFLPPPPLAEWRYILSSLTFRPSLLQSKFLVLQNLLGPWVESVLRRPLYSHLCIRHCGAELTRTSYRHGL